jgi:centrosomal protein CEP164
MAAVPKSGEVYYADDGTVSIVLDDNYDPNYEPPQKEIDEYARWLGIDVENEKDLLFIARDGLKAPLPKEWKPCKTDTGEVYYFNFKTGESIWDHPMDEVYKKRVADERAKRGTGSSLGANAELGKKTGGGASSKLVKGGAGAKQEPAAGSSRGRFAAAADDVKPKTARLGALGSGNDDSGSKPIRPDISDILPAKTEGSGGGFLSSSSGSNLLLGKKKEPLKDTRELERKFREKYQTEFTATRQALKENHGKAIDKLREELEAQMRRERNNLQSEMDDEVEQCRRAAERRNKRELAIFEESIEKQKEDLRRTLRTLQEKYDADSLGVSRRVENELAEKRNTASRTMAADISQRRQELQEAWQREKVQAELNTQSLLRDAKVSFERQVEEATMRESQSVVKRIAELEEALLLEQQQVREALQAERHQHTAKLQALISASDASGSLEYAAANSEFQRAVEEAKSAAESALEAIRAEYKQKTANAQREHDMRLAEANQSNAALLLSNEREAVAQRTQLGQQRISAVTEEQNARTAEEVTRYAQETERLVQQAKDQQRAVAERAQREAQDARAAVMQRHEAAVKAIEEKHALREEALRNEHTASLAKLGLLDVTATPEFHSMLESAKAQWLAKNPAPIHVLPTRLQASVSAPPTGAPAATGPPRVETVHDEPTPQQIAALVEPALAAERRRLAAEKEEKIQHAKRTMQAEELQYLQEHRAKAMNEITERLRVYKQERLASPSRTMLRHQQSAARPVSPPKDLQAAVQQRRAELQEAYWEEEAALQRALTASRLSSQSAATSSSVTSAPAAPLAVRGRPSSTEPQNAPREDEIFQPPQQLRSSSANIRALLPTAASGSAQLQMAPQHAAGVFDAAAIAALLHHAAAAVTSSAQNTPSKQKKSRHSTMPERIATAHEMLRRKKKELRSRQDQLEAARNDWKKDMAQAKANGDKAMQEALAKVKTALEEEARMLNKDAIALKESLAYLQAEEKALTKQQQSPPRLAAHQLPEGPRELQALVVQLLQKTSEMEQRLAAAERRAPSSGASPKGTKHHHHHHPDADGRGEASGRDRIVEKWSQWLRENARSTPAVHPLPVTANAGAELQVTPKKDQVQKWLSEQP